MYGPLIAAFSICGFLGSIPFWYKAGKGYRDYMVEQEKQKIEPYSI